MKITRKQLNRIVKESIWDDLGAEYSTETRIHKPTRVTNDDTFYWIARLADEVQPGFVVPASGPIEHARDIENLYEEVRRELNPTAPSRFNCVYVCPSLNGFCKKPSGLSFGHQGGVYRVRVSGNVFVTDAELWTEGITRGQRGDMSSARGYAEGYWEGMSLQEAKNPNPDYTAYQYHEALVDGTVTVIERVY